MLFRFFRDLSIKSKMILLFIVVSIIPIMTIGVISLEVSSDAMLEKEVKDSENSLEFIDYKVNEIIEESHLDTLRAAYNEYIMSYYEDSSQLSSEAFSKVENETKIQLMSYYNSQNVTSITLVNEDGEALYYSPAFYSSVQKLLKPEQVPENLDEFKFFDMWRDAIWEGLEPVIPYVRIVIGQKSGKPTAYLVMNIKEEVFNNVYKGYEVTSGTTYFMVNENGTIQSCSDKEKFSRNIQDVLGFSNTKFTNGMGYFISDISGEKSIVSYTHNDQREYYFIAVTPMAKAIGGFIPILVLTVIIGILCIAVCILLGYLMSRAVTKPLYALIDRISLSEVKSDSQMITSKNELMILSDKYGKILAHLEGAINQYYDEQKKKKEAEIKALEFQINPHFMYNTLATIIWLIEKNEKRKAIKITKKLSAFFRISISKGREFITIKDEITHVDLYLDIQKTRYEEKIFIEYDVPDTLLLYYTPKLILQPLVENSIYHAMHEREDKTGHLRIVGRFDGDDIILEVWDNGDKVTQQTIEEMNNFLHNRKSASVGKEYGIGISNVHDRVVMCFGEGYGLTYRRENDVTIASVRIRATNGEEVNV